MHKSLLAAAVATAFAVPALAGAQQTPPPDSVPPAAAEPAAMPAEQGSVLDVARAAGNFATLLRAIEVAGLTDTLSAAGQFTLFAPTDEAFARLPEGALDALLADPATLRELLLGHVMVTRVSAEEVQAQENAVTAGGARHGVTRDGERLLVGGATVVKADLAAANGVLHAVDAVIVPAATTPAPATPATPPM